MRRDRFLERVVMLQFEMIRALTLGEKPEPRPEPRELTDEEAEALAVKHDLVDAEQETGY